MQIKFLKIQNKFKQTSKESFPWISATVCYSISWCFLLLRPNTVYWDDWQMIFERPAGYLGAVRTEMGLPPWSSWVESVFLPNNVLALRIMTFVMFYICGLFFFKIITTHGYCRIKQAQIITIIFLVAPVNHARIGSVMFMYSLSYFLFFGAWLTAVKAKRILTFYGSLVPFFLSLTTHSFLFFILLPFCHFLLVNYSEQRRVTFQATVKSISILVLVPTYLLLRKIFWTPTERWTNYHSASILSGLRGMFLFVPTIALLIFMGFLVSKNRKIRPFLVISTVGFFSLAVSLYPYVLSDKINRYFYKYNLGWQNRHLMLTPLGISLIVMGLSLIAQNKKYLIAKIFVVISILINLFAGSQYYLQAIQQDEIVDLLKSNRIDYSISEFKDETTRFKGRGEHYDDYEFFGMLRLAGYKYPIRVGYKYICEAAPEGVQLTLKSDVSYLQGLRTRKLGTYFQITPCAEVISTNT